MMCLGTLGGRHAYPKGLDPATINKLIDVYKHFLKEIS